MNFWSILGIQPTNNLKDIKRAYAKQSKVYHPEDDPENFQRLQKAYQEALAWQKLHSENEDMDAVIGHKQADGSVVGLVSASQLSQALGSLERAGLTLKVVEPRQLGSEQVYRELFEVN